MALAGMRSRLQSRNAVQFWGLKRRASWCQALSRRRAGQGLVDSAGHNVAIRLPRHCICYCLLMIIRLTRLTRS